MHLTYPRSKHNRAKPVFAEANQAGAPEITNRMIDAGLRALADGLGSADEFSLVKEIYTAMWAASPGD